MLVGVCMFNRGRVEYVVISPLGAVRVLGIQGGQQLVGGGLLRQQGLRVLVGREGCYLGELLLLRCLLDDSTHYLFRIYYYLNMKQLIKKESYIRANH